MNFKDNFTALRKKAGLSQNEIADKLFVTRQAVSRWEQGDTVPEIETLQAISKLFGMPIDPGEMGREKDGTPNEHYCKWCRDNGEFLSDCTMEEMVEWCLPYMPFGTPESNRKFLTDLLPTLDRWKKREP